MRGVERWSGWLGAVGLAGLLSACAGTPHDVSLPIYDPNEQFNRGVLHLNQVVLDPPATVVKSVPGVIRNRFEDLNANLKEPGVLANDILQGRLNAAGITIARTIINTTFGLGGLFDVAATAGNLPQQTGDFGQTMFVWGVPAGSYTVTPYFGPSTQRDAIGGIVDTFGDPVGIVGGIYFGWPWGIGSGAVSAVAHLALWKQAESSSVDFYPFLRSSFYQTRRNQLREAVGLPPQVESPAAAGPVVGFPATEIPPPQ
jgi:phospholipid-binding lipoprotein MlaA